MKSTDAAIADSQSSAANEAAPAKVNLALHILGRCADGYHDIDSLVVFADAGDSIGVRSDGPLALELDGPFAGELAAATSAGDNLVLRAARELASFAKRKAEGLTLTLTKALPVAAGLGGGSADAAATLRLLNRYWRLDASPEDLAEIGSALGADIPMCLRSIGWHPVGVIVRRPLEGPVSAVKERRVGAHGVALDANVDVPTAFEGAGCAVAVLDALYGECVGHWHTLTQCLDDGLASAGEWLGSAGR